MKYTDDQKIKMLRYAKQHGVVAAAEHYKIPHYLLVSWNRKFKIYKPQTLNYSMATRRLVLEYAAVHGQRAAAQKFGVSVSVITIWNKEMQVYGRKTKTFTDAQKIEILEFARDFGRAAAVDKYDVDPATISRWNRKYRIYDRLETYSRDQIIERLMFVRDNGLAAAAKKYNMAKFTFNRWNKEYKIYAMQGPGNYVPYNQAQQQEILRYALSIYNDLPSDIRSAYMAFTETAKVFSVTKDQLGVWNRKFRIVPTRPSGRRQLSDKEVAEIQRVLNKSRGSIAATARNTQYSELRIKKLITDKRISFKKGRDMVHKDMPVGKKKAGVIGAILSGLLSRK